MAFGKINETHDGVAFKRYYGIAPVKVLAVNPSTDELNKLGFNTTTPVEYNTKTDDGIDQVRIDFIVETIADKCNGISTKFRVPFTLRKKAVKGSQSGKYQIMDIYGRTAWATKEDIDAKRIPQYTNGPANISANYSVLCEGEESLTTFIRTYLGIPNVTKFINGAPAGMIDNPADAEGKLDCVKDYFSGNFSELKEIIKLAPNNWIKILVGVRTTEDNKQYQTVFTRGFVSGGSNNYNRLSKILQENLSLGRYGDTYFGPIIDNTVLLSELKEYEVNASVVTPNNKPIPDTMPFDNEANADDEMPF